jgi:hypothetical protein
LGSNRLNLRAVKAAAQKLAPIDYRVLVLLVAAALLTWWQYNSFGTASSSGWNTVVDDQFDRDGPVPSHWRLYHGPYDSPPYNCPAPSHAYVSGGAMHMIMSYERAKPSGVSCPYGPGWYTGGMQLDAAYQSIDQVIELRYRVVNTDRTHVSSHRNIPMHFGAAQSPSWPHGGEVDYCEGERLTSCHTFLHYFGTSRNDQITSPVYVFNLARWNTLRVERRKHTIRVYINGTLDWIYKGNATTLPDVAQRAVLQQECQAGGCPSSSFAGQKEDIQIDWIKIQNPA